MNDDHRNAKHEHHSPEQEGKRSHQYWRPATVMPIRMTRVIAGIKFFIAHQAKDNRLDKTIQNRDEQHKKGWVVPPYFGARSQRCHHQTVEGHYPGKPTAQVPPMCPDDTQKGSKQAKPDFGNETWIHKTQLMAEDLQSGKSLSGIVIPPPQ